MASYRAIALFELFFDDDNSVLASATLPEAIDRWRRADADRVGVARCRGREDFLRVCSGSAADACSYGAIATSATAARTRTASWLSVVPEGDHVTAAAEGANCADASNLSTCCRVPIAAWSAVDVDVAAAWCSVSAESATSGRYTAECGAAAISRIARII